MVTDLAIRTLGFLTWQTTELLAFVGALHEHCRQRERGTDRRGATKGSHNGKLADAMEDIWSVSDLENNAIR